MQKLLSALVVLTVLAGAMGSAQAASFGSQQYWIDHDTNMN